MVKAALANLAWCLAGASATAAFARALDDPAAAQERILRGLLRTNADTAFGREHGFADIKTPEQFARRVPAREYDELSRWIDRIRRGESRVLTAQPVLRLVPTSGSAAARKLIPYTASMHDELNCAVAPWIFDLYRREPRALPGCAYWSVSPVGEKPVAPDDSVVPVGFDEDAQYLGGPRKWMVDAAMAVPSAVRTISDIGAWRYVTLLLLLRRGDLSLISVWHPSFLQLLWGAINDHWRELVTDIASGGCSRAAQLPDTVRRILWARPDPRRAREIERAGPYDLPRLWPGLRIVSCWADGHAIGAAGALAKLVRHVTIQPKGLVATEGIISIPYAGHRPLAVRSHYLEFEDDTGRIVGVSGLMRGRCYQVLLTNGGGLCRYRLRDVIHVEGTLGRTPTIRFVGRTGVVSDRAGEKLNDAFVAAVLARLFAERSLDPSFAMLAPDQNGAACHYTLYTNGDLPPDFATSLDTALAENPNYAHCRYLGQLGPPRVTQLTGNPYPRYADRLRADGQRQGDIKPAALSPLEGWSRWFRE
jgi:hypothetical protein